MPVTFFVHGDFVVPDTQSYANFIIVTMPDGRVRWKTGLMPAVARVVRPWCKKVGRSRLVHRSSRPSSLSTHYVTTMAPPSIKMVLRDLFVSGGDKEDGSDLLSVRSTRRYVWEDNALKEDKSA